MKLTCTQERFKKAVYNCERVVSKKNTLPILNNILLEAEKSGVKLSATNLEIGVVTKNPAKVERPGSITVPAKLLSNFSTNLSGGGNIEIEVVEDKLKIKSETNKTIIRGIPANDFPLIPSKKTEYLLEFPGFQLKNILSSILPAVAFNEARQELTGVNLIFKSDMVFFAATDSFRLAEYKIKLDINKINQEIYPIFIEKNKNIIIPANTLTELGRIVSSDDEVNVKIAVEEGQIFFEINGTKLVSRLINGKYPDYEHIIPKEYKTKIVGEKQTLQGAIKMASIFSSASNNEIVLKIDSEEGKIFTMSSSAEAGENSTELNFDVSGPSQQIIFNAKYLLDGISASSTAKVAILLNSESTPVAIKEIKEYTGEVLENFTYIVMPIKN